MMKKTTTSSYHDRELNISEHISGPSDNLATQLDINDNINDNSHGDDLYHPLSKPIPISNNNHHLDSIRNISSFQQPHPRMQHIHLQQQQQHQIYTGTNHHELVNIHRMQQDVNVPFERQDTRSSSSTSTIKESNSRKRFRKTCENCARSKVKCTSTQPKCERCESHGWDCRYAEERKRGRKNYYDKLNELVNQQQKQTHQTKKDSAETQSQHSSSADDNNDNLYPIGMKASTPSLQTLTLPSSNQNLNKKVTYAFYTSLNENRTLLSKGVDGERLVLILNRTELKVERIFLLLFRHLFNNSKQCECKTGPDVYCSNTYPLHLGKYIEFTQYLHRSDKVDEYLLQDDSQNDFYFQMLLTSHDNFTALFERHYHEAFASTIGPKPNRLLQILRSGLGDSSTSSSPSGSLSLQVVGNENFSKCRIQALELDVPILKIYISVNGLVSTWLNQQFSSLFGFTLDDMNSMLGASLFTGLLPWGADILSLLMSSDDDLLSYIHNLSIKFHRNFASSPNLIREGWVEDIYRFSSKLGVEFICILRSIIRESVTAAGNASEIIFQFLPNSSIKSNEMHFASGNRSSSDTLLPSSLGASSSSSSLYNKNTSVIQSSLLVESGNLNRFPSNFPKDIHGSASFPLSSSREALPIEISSLDQNFALPSSHVLANQDHPEQLHHFGESRGFVHINDNSSHSRDESSNGGLYAGLSWATGIPPGWQETIPTQQGLR